MKSRIAHFRDGERGIAAVELAFILPILIACLWLPLFFFSAYFWHYTVSHRAAQDAARYLSTITPLEMRMGSLAKAADQLAHQIALAELAELNPGPTVPEVQSFCGTQNCTGVGTAELPRTIRVTVTVNMFDTIFGWWDAGRFGLQINAVSEVPYVHANAQQ